MVAEVAQSPGEMYALATVLPAIATLFVALRFRARYLTGTYIGWDDWLVAASLCFTYVIGVFIIVATAKGDMAQHMIITPTGPVHDAKYDVFLRMMYGTQVTQTVAIGLTKISVLLLYRRIFRGKWFNIVNWTFIAIAIGWTISFTLGNMLECLPISVSFLNAPGLDNDSRCDNTVPMYMAQVYIDCIMDVLILVLPIPLVWKLKLATKQKVAVCGMFLLGFITTMSSCAKMIVYYLLAMEMTQVPDQSYFLSPVIYWGVIESTLQIVAACLPLLRPIFGAWFGSSRKQSHTEQSHAMYSNITSPQHLNRRGTVSSISQPFRSDDGEAGLKTGYISDDSQPQNFMTETVAHQHDDSKEIHVQQTFNASVNMSPLPPIKAKQKTGMQWPGRR